MWEALFVWLGQGDCVVFLDKTLYSHSADSLHQGVYGCQRIKCWELTLRAFHPGEVIYPYSPNATETRIRSDLKIHNLKKVHCWQLITAHNKIYFVLPFLLFSIFFVLKYICCPLKFLYILCFISTIPLKSLASSFCEVNRSKNQLILIHLATWEIMPSFVATRILYLHFFGAPVSCIYFLFSLFVVPTCGKVTDATW